MSVRLDKWLWAVRLYKTRALATDACRLGKITQNGIIAKASKEVKIGDRFEINLNQLH
ncbi:MAG: RNA-binding S4 domain-containing protein, partial [Bacteroidales bacterium]|nr:RNA-binding S4 domain-containing protein [Bacteroidales bacterium]